MDLSAGIKLATIRGIEIRVHWSWLIILVLLSWSLADTLFREDVPEWSAQQRWLAAVASSALFFGSVLTHELAHAIMAQRLGMRVPSITLFVFGGVSTIAGEMTSARAEFRVAVVGPLTSAALAVLFGALWLATRGEGIASAFGYLATTNGALALFNLLPGFPLDGGRVLRSAVWGRSGDLVRATRVAARSGTALAMIMIGGGLIAVLAFGLFQGIWYILIGLFLRSAAEGSYVATVTDQALQNLLVRTVMRPPRAPVDPSMTIETLVESRVLATAERAYIIGTEDAVVGLLTTSDIGRLEREQWPTTTVRQAMVPVDRVITVTPETPLVDAMNLLREHNIHQLPVVERGRFVGMLTSDDVIRQIEVRLRFRSNET
jgi:Zn-dependent protease/CBS domain-containing protein